MYESAGWGVSGCGRLAGKIPPHSKPRWHDTQRSARLSSGFQIWRNPEWNLRASSKRPACASTRLNRCCHGRHGVAYSRHSAIATSTKNTIDIATSQAKSSRSKDWSWRSAIGCAFSEYLRQHRTPAPRPIQMPIRAAQVEADDDEDDDADANDRKHGVLPGARARKPYALGAGRGAIKEWPQD